MASWKDLEGVTLAEKFQLQHLIFDRGASACFQVRLEEGASRSAWLWLVLTDGDAAARQLKVWTVAAGLSHPNLAPVWETGWIERGVTSMAYFLTEPADADLAAVLRERPLDQVEACEAVLCTAKVLSYLHSCALVHGNLEPALILAKGDRIKLSSHTIAPSIESSDGILSEANDLRALGDCIHAIFTQNTSTDLERLPVIPQPFRDIIRGCYGVNPNDRWDAQRIVSTLEEPDAAAPTVAVEPRMPVAVPPPPAPMGRKRIPVFWIAIATIAAVVLLLFPRKPAAKSHLPMKPAADSKTSPMSKPVAPAPPARVAPAPGFFAKPSGVTESRVWRVITYTYSKAEDAGRMVREINRQWPDLRAEQFSPNAGGPPYLVALGGRMYRNEAVRLRQRAISSGLPSDTFVRNFRE